MTAQALPYWRRLIVPGAFTIVGLAILISLGVWQLQRKLWKEDLIATLDAQLKAEPLPLPPPSQWDTLTRENSEFRRVSLRVTFVPPYRPPVYIYTGPSALRADVRQPGYFVFSPAQLPGGQTIVINRGYVGMDRKQDEPPAETEITGYIRWPEKEGFFVPDHGTDDIRFVRDPAAMAKAFNWGPVAPFYIDQEAPVPASGMPRPGSLSVKLRNDHLGYALTWFGLAAALAGIFVIWAAQERYQKTS